MRFSVDPINCLQSHNPQTPGSPASLHKHSLAVTPAPSGSQEVAEGRRQSVQRKETCSLGRTFPVRLRARWEAGYLCSYAGLATHRHITHRCHHVSHTVAIYNTQNERASEAAERESGLLGFSPGSTAPSGIPLSDSCPSVVKQEPTTVSKPCSLPLSTPRPGP